MKKLNLLIAAGIMAFSLTGCSNGTAENTTTAESTTTAANDTAAPSTTDTAESTAAEGNTEAEGSTTGSSDTETADEGGSNALVVYFSATGTTKAVAETLADLQGADLFEIVPEQPYTDEDLNYNDRTTRATAEQDDPDARPAIAQAIDNLDDYDTIYVGYPIWWGDMPRIMYTFFDAYDLSGKTIAPFCTSGGSGLSGTQATIAELEPEATVLDGLHVSGDTEGALSDWLTEIGLN